MLKNLYNMIKGYLSVQKCKIDNFYRKFRRSCKWFIRMWNNEDWDSHYLIEMILYKLKDMQYQFDILDSNFIDLRHQPKNVDEDCEEFEDHLSGLDESIKIGERLYKSEYIEYPPEIEEWFKNHSVIDEIPHKINNKLNKIYSDADKREKLDNKKFFNLIRDEHNKWWS